MESGGELPATWEIVCASFVLSLLDRENSKLRVTMSLTIDQQRQRVEHEITRMVDDLDKSAMRKMQVNRQVSSGFSISCELAE